MKPKLKSVENVQGHINIIQNQKNINAPMSPAGILGLSLVNSGVSNNRRHSVRGI